MPGRDDAIRAAARRHGLSEAAVAALWDALARGGGRQAQFSHPELGGMGQWSGGMGQIGDMFNAALKAKVVGACADLSAAMSDAGTAAEPSIGQRRSPVPARASVPQTGRTGYGTGASRQPSIGSTPLLAPFDANVDWWPGDLGRPASSGAQNGVRYAVFPDRRRLAIEREGRVLLYDTGRHRIGGVSQAQSTGSHLAFTSQDGPVDLDTLTVVDR